MIDELLSAGAVARRLGVAVTTLRTWHQRYGLGPSRHVPGQHRRYTAEDLNRLQLMLRLTAQGVAPAEAAAWARRTPGDLPVDPPSSGAPLPDAEPSGTRLSGARPSGDGITGRNGGAATSNAAPGAGEADSGAGTGGTEAGGVGAGGVGAGGVGAGGVGAGGPVPGEGRDGGGQAIALGTAVPAARGLARAAMRLDSQAMRAIFTTAIADRGVIGAWTDVATPVLIGIGDRYQATRRFVEVEHLLSRCVTEVLSAVPRPSGTEPPRVLLAAADEEQHTLALEALAAALAEADVPTRLLGGRVPPQALADAVARTGPAVVVLWSQTSDTGDPAQLARLAGPPHAPLLLAAAGPGWSPALPPGVSHPTSLLEARNLVRSAVS